MTFYTDLMEKKKAQASVYTHPTEKKLKEAQKPTARDADLNFDPDATINELEEYARARESEAQAFQPLGDWMLVEPEVESDVTPAGVVKVREEKPRPVRGTVLSVGLEANSSLVGAMVVFGKFTGVKIELDGKEYILLHQNSDVYGWLEND